MMSPIAHFQLSMLTRREREILQLIACGMTSLTIANALGISIHTVRQHRTNMRRKMDMRHPGALIRYAILQLRERNVGGCGERHDLLSAREREICRLIGQGVTNENIAAQLGISRLTVRKHRQNAMRKFGARGTVDFIRCVADVFVE
ncbi:helix-turn-helix transcriptional regulator [Dyella sp. C11]|uniref:helix-turn-helix domain-containing protein n=1 Tax=Dyella sp. C11 TaxID=2126991 RepID=UPI0018E52F29|nr:helix-turn-helix transcriptional regulator [Dyella sp. C11]